LNEAKGLSAQDQRRARAATNQRNEGGCCDLGAIPRG